jgi:hypothetical protein
MIWVAACAGGNAASPTGASDAAPADAGAPADGLVSGSDGGSPGSDGGNPGSDGGTDGASDHGPFPADPKGGEFAWIVSAPGAGDVVVTAVDAAGNIVVAATQTGEVTLGDVHVAAASDRESVLVLKLTPDGKPIWGRSFSSQPRFQPNGIAITASGDVVVGATSATYELGSADGFVALLDGATGDTRWSLALSSPRDDGVAGVAAGPDAAGEDAIYIYGHIDADTMIAGQSLAKGTYLIRFADDGTLRWARSFPQIDISLFSSSIRGSLALDAVRGPVVTGLNAGGPALDDLPLSFPGSEVVVGFTPDGGVRFARELQTTRPSLFWSITVAPGGDLYVGSDTGGTVTALDGNSIQSPGFSGSPFLLRLTSEGRYVSSVVIATERQEWTSQVAIDAAGAAYTVASCSGHVNVQPEVDCNGGAGSTGSVVASYGPDNAALWATYVKGAFVEAIAAAPGNRVILAGQAFTGSLVLGGVTVTSQRLFIAALAGGQPRPPSPLPPSPQIASVTLDGTPDGQIRQGNTGTLVIAGDGLDHVTSARLGNVEVHVPPGIATAGAMRLTVTIPHGAAPGPLGLTLRTAGGAATMSDVITVTPIVVSPSGTIGGRGTYTSPMLLCRTDWSSLTGYGDELLLLNGVHACNGAISTRGGVMIHGESKGATIVQGTGGPNGTFGGFAISGFDVGSTTVENLTITSAIAGLWAGAVTVSNNASAVVRDVDVRGVAGDGVSVNGDASVTLERYSYSKGNANAIAIWGGRVDASEVSVDGASGGVWMYYGVVTLRSSSLSSKQPTIHAGDLNALGGTRDITVIDSTLRSSAGGILAGESRITVRGSTIEPPPEGSMNDGIALYGGELTVVDSLIRGWGYHGILVDPQFTIEFGAIDRPADPLRDDVSVTLDGAEIAGCDEGIIYNGGFAGRFRMRNSHVQSSFAPLWLDFWWTQVDLGTVASPGNNELEATTLGEPALGDGRSFVGNAVDAHGTMLNGVSYGGDVVGPATSGDYRLAGANTIHF